MPRILMLFWARGTCTCRTSWRTSRRSSRPAAPTSSSSGQTLSRARRYHWRMLLPVSRALPYGTDCVSAATSFLNPETRAEVITLEPYSCTPKCTPHP
eukprot:174640-Rhodomonas_salina.1